MQRDVLYEESATCNAEGQEKKMYMFFLVLSVIAFSIAGIWILYSVMAIQSYLFGQNYTAFGKIFGVVRQIAVAALLLGLGVLFWFIKKRFNRSFDYTFVEDELRVTKVFNGRSRKYLMTVKADQILKIGWCDKRSFEDTQRGLRYKPVRLTPNKTPAEEKEMIYVLVSGTLGNKLYVLECRRELLELIVRAASVTKLERE